MWNTNLSSNAPRALLVLLFTATTACPSEDDDGGDDDAADGGESAAVDAGSTGDAGSAGDGGPSGGDDQGRNVRVCTARVVCEDGTVNEQVAPICATPAEVNAEIAWVGEACIEDMTPACERIGDGTTVDCGLECSEAMEPCSCEDPAMGCAV